jgi:hypothetical protein
MRCRFLWVCRLLVAAFLFAPDLPAAAREIKINVIDGDLDEPLAGAVVHLPDGAVYDTDVGGTAVFSVPDEKSLEIKITYPGYESASLPVKNDGTSSYTVTMYIHAGNIENEELVIEGYMPGTERGRSGRSVLVNREEIVRGAEIGLIEDVMASIKLLPGVGYTGVFNAHPSIRGGQPGDLKASLNGFYIDNPYHWGGGYSIFDPKTIESAELHHGVFSARYSHTISGLLELKSLRASSEYIEAGLNLSTSAAGFNISYPLPDFSNLDGAKRGAVMLIGKITYWEPFVAIAKTASKFIPVLLPVNVVSVTPYIRSLTVLANYSLSADAELNFTGYAGGDGVGLLYNNSSSNIDILSNSRLKFTWDNLIAFSAVNLLVNPNPDMIIKTNIGFSYASQLMEAEYEYDVTKSGLVLPIGNIKQRYDDKTIGAQARVDFDWDIKNGFLFSAGVEELTRQWIESADSNMVVDAYFTDGYRSVLRDIPDINNMGFFSGLYSLVEYKEPGGRFDAEGGLRIEHLYFIGKSFDIATIPIFNPRLNFAYHLLRNRGGIDVLTLSAGVGLFSALGGDVAYINKNYAINDFDLKQSRALTAVTGMKVDFLKDWIFSLESYYKYVFDNAYITNVYDEKNNTAVPKYNFDGEGHIWGFDLMLRRIKGRLIDGWISYSFTYARYHDPRSMEAFSGAVFVDRNNNWYFPSFHRFSNLNLVLNFKPLRGFNIYTRFGFASGVPKNKVAGAAESISVKQPNGETIIKYKRNSVYDDAERGSASLPLDIKFSWFFFYPDNKVRTEVYAAVENALSLVYRPKGSTIMNPYTGEEEDGSITATFELPIPMVSFGFKWTY